MELNTESCGQISLKEVRGGGEERETVAGNINPHHRILRLERSIAWLKDQHGQMVASLHNEIETLKHRNRGMALALKTFKNLAKSQHDRD